MRTLLLLMIEHDPQAVVAVLDHIAADEQHGHRRSELLPWRFFLDRPRLSQGLQQF